MPIILMDEDRGNKKGRGAVSPARIRVALTM